MGNRSYDSGWRGALGGSAFWVSLVFLLVWIIPASEASFPRPWQNGSWVAANPSIWSYGMEYWWNLPELHKTIESVDFDAIAGIGANGTTKAHIDKAAANAKSAEKDKNICILETISSLGSPTLLYLKSFSGTSSCMAYRRDWTGAVDSVLLSVEESIRAASGSISEAREPYEKMRFAGLCNDNYTGPGSGSCAELESAFYSVDSNITEGNYGKYALLLNFSAQLSPELSGFTPDISLSGTMLGLVWGENGIIATFTSARDLAKKSLQDAEQEFQQRQKSASERKSLAESSFSDLEGEELERIDKAPSGFGTRKGGSVAERFEKLKKEAQLLEGLLTEAKLEHGKVTKQAYLANAINQAAEADEGYASLPPELSDLKDDAEDVVGQQKKEAEEEITQTERYLSGSPTGSEAGEMLEQAKSDFDAGDGGGSLGADFEKFSSAAALARAARGAQTFDEELGGESSLASLESLIGRAEKDQINVISEKESLKMVKKMPLYETGDAVNEAIDGIIAKARIKYEDDLLSTHERIHDKLLLAGDGAADLLTDMSNYEEGILEEGEIAFPDSIGSLKRLQSDYSKLEETIDAYMGDIVGNAMSVSCDPIISDVALDEPADITLDAVLSNPRGYNATNVEATVRMQKSVQFLYSDMEAGKDDVDSVRTADGGRTIMLSFPHVDAYETKRVVFGKKGVLAHTVKRVRSAEGIGYGAARVKDEIDFELDTDIASLSLPEGFEGALIDGSPSAGAPTRLLYAGKHTISSERIIEDAYAESVENVKVYRAGTNSKVEYDIRIEPRMDLSSSVTFIDSINDSKISSFSVSSGTGEMVDEKNRVSDTQYAIRVVGLIENRTAVLKVSYDVEDTKSFVKEQLDRLEGMNLSAEASRLLSQARMQADGGNDTMALELIEKSVAQSRGDEKELSKLQGRCDELRAILAGELKELDGALSTSADKTAPMIQKLKARKSELERIQEELNSSGMNLSEIAGQLESIDFKWLDKELNSFKKQAYADYNGFKERFAKAGNTSTPAEFLSFEDALSKLESGGRAEYAVVAVDALGKAESVVEAQEAQANASRAILKSALSDLKSGVSDTLESYSKQASAAKGTDYSSLFSESDKKVEKLIDDAEAALDEDPRLLSGRLEALNKSRERMELTLESLKNESEAKISLLERTLEGKNLGDSKQKTFAEKIEAMRKLVSAGDYVNALRAGSAMAKELDSEEGQGDNGLLVIGVTAVAGLAAAGFLVAKQQNPKKELKKLTSFSGPGPQAGPPSRPETAGREALQGAQGRLSRSSQSPGLKQPSGP